MKQLPTNNLNRAISFGGGAFWSLGKTSNQTVPDEAVTKLSWEKENTQSYGVHVDLANNRVYIMRSGKYHISASHGAYDNGSGSMWWAYMWIYKNGVQVERAFTFGGQGDNRNYGAIFEIDLVAGDYIEIYTDVNTYLDATATIPAAGSANAYTAAIFDGMLINE